LGATVVTNAKECPYSQNGDMENHPNSLHPAPYTQVGFIQVDSYQYIETFAPGPKT